MTKCRYKIKVVVSRHIDILLNNEYLPISIMKETKFVKDIQKFGFNKKEALVYYSLIEYGKKGSNVKNLKNQTGLERTTIYSILNRLIDLGYVFERLNSIVSNQTKIFVAINPRELAKRIIAEKQKELSHLIKIRDSKIEQLEIIFLGNNEVLLETLDDSLKAFLKPLIDKGWKIIDYHVEKSVITRGFEVYDLNLLNPKAKFVKNAGFMVFKYDYEVENDENALNYMYGLLKRKGREEIFRKDIGVIDIKLHEVNIDIKGSKYKGFIPEFMFEESNSWTRITEIVMIPRKDIIFSLWAENHEYLIEMTEGFL
ncbi:MAG: hypothetical protein JW891_08780 [Candidatus Lokiarchaeota archaeon]|nr:hypothetical protein [Candidatus Lokiarchaeota archaeon]